MRNLYECQAEVFRRSEKRIKERKRRRNHILAVCVPLVLCIGLSSAFFLRDVLPEKSADPGSTEPVNGNITTQPYSESLAFPIEKITVSGGNISQSYTDKADVKRLSDWLSPYSTKGAVFYGSVGDVTIAESQDNKEDADGVSGSVLGSVSAEYRITLFSQKGDKMEFDLTGSTLKNLSTKQTFVLTDTQLEELKDLLGISR